jgi:AraC-like DNA-binding protein
MLRPFAQFIWHMSSDEPVANGKLLPVINTDLIISVSSPIFYHFADEEPLRAPSVHFRNVKLRPQFVTQAAGCDVWGISLLPYGAYLFTGDMSSIGESIIDLCAESPQICLALTEGLRCLPERPALIEEQIGKLVKATIPDLDRGIMDGYFSHMLHSDVVEYCEASGIGVKRLERLIKKYTGLTPKQLQRVARFQYAGNDILYNPEPPPLADIAYAHDYADQTHLTRAFREYAGMTPFMFMTDSGSVKELIHRQD